MDTQHTQHNIWHCCETLLGSRCNWYFVVNYHFGLITNSKQRITIETIVISLFLFIYFIHIQYTEYRTISDISRDIMACKAFIIHKIYAFFSGWVWIKPAFFMWFFFVWLVIRAVGYFFFFFASFLFLLPFWSVSVLHLNSTTALWILANCCYLVNKIIFFIVFFFGCWLHFNFNLSVVTLVCHVPSILHPYPFNLWSTR